jgi:putative transposase
LAHQRVGRPHGSRAHDGTITTERVDLMGGTDLTSVMTGEGQAAVFIAVDHGSAECVGIHRAPRARSAPAGTARGSGQRASRSADRFEALEPVRQAVRERFGGFGKDIAGGLQLRHDHGSQHISHDFQAELRFLGIPSSPAFVREPEGKA